MPVNLTDRAPRLDDAKLDELAIRNDSQFGRGLRSGALSGLGQLNTLAGAAGQAVNAPEFAQGRLTAADDYNAQAAQAQPRVASLRDVHSIGDFGDWAAGAAGGMLPMAGAAIGAGALTGGGAIPAALAGTAVMAPLEIGDVLQRQRAEGRPMSLRDAVPAGLGSAALQNIVPGLARAKLTGKAAAGSLTSNLAMLPEQAALAGGGELAKQGGAGQEMDLGAAGEAAATGGIMAVPFAGMGAMGSARGAAGKALDVAKEAPGKALAATKEALAPGKPQDVPPDAPGGPSSAAAEGLSGIVERAKATARGAIDRVAEGFPASAKAAEDLAGKTGTAAKEALDKLDGETLSKVKQWATDLSEDAGLTPEKRAELGKYASDIGSEASQRGIAAMKRAQTMGRGAAESINEGYEHIKGWYESAKDKAQGGAKKSEDFGGIRKAIAEHLIPALQDVNPGALDKAENVTKLADAVRMFIEQTSRGQDNKKATAFLSDQLGMHASDVLDKIHRSVYGPERAKAEGFFASLNQMREMQKKGETSPHQVMMKNLKPEFQGDFTTRDMRKMAEHLVDWSKRSGDGSEAARFKDQQINDVIDQHFDNPEHVRKAIEREAKDREPVVAATARMDEDGKPIDTDFDNPGRPTAAAQEDRMRVSKKLVTSPEEHRKQYGEGSDKGQAVREIEDARAKYPGADVRWMDAEEWHAKNGGEAPADSEGKGYVVAEQAKGSDKLTPAQAVEFRFDTQKGNRATDRTAIDTGNGKSFADALKLASFRNGKDIPWSAGDDVSNMRRMATTFFSNVAALQEHLGRSFEVPDRTIVSKRNGGITVGDLRKFDMSEATKDKWMKGLTDDQIEAELRRKDTLVDLDKPALKRLEVKMHDRIDALEEKARDAAKDELDELRAHGASATKKVAREIYAKHLEAVREEHPEAYRQMESVAREMYKRDNDEGSEARTAAGASRDVDHEGNIHVAEKMGDKAILHKTNLDGTPVGSSQPSMERQKQQAAKRALREALDAGEPPSPKAVAAKKAAFLEKARSGDTELLKTLASSDDAKGLQRAVDALGKEKGEGVQKTVDAINKRLGELVQNPDVAYGMQLENKRSLQGVDPQNSNTTGARGQVLSYLNDVLGNTIGVEFKKFADMPHAGEFERVMGPRGVEDIVRISVHALNPMSTAHHEALHAWFQQLSDKGLHDVMKPLLQAADNPFVVKQLKALLHNEPDALKQLGTAEERVAYMYQFWSQRNAQGERMLRLGGEPKGIFERLAKMFRDVLGVWSNDERAQHILEYFDKGDYAKNPTTDAVRRATLEPGRNAVLDKARAMTEPLAKLADTIGVAGAQRLRDTGIPALNELATLVKATGRGDEKDPGFITAARVERTRVMNELGEQLHRFSDSHIHEALEGLQAHNRAASTEAKAAQATIKQVLRRSLNYLRDAGVNVSDLGPDYFPRVYDPNFISRNQTAFIQVLEKHGVTNAAEVMHKIVGADGNEFQIETMRPGMQNLKLRKLGFIPDAELAPFMRKDLYGIMNSYVSQAARRAEWARRFDDDGKRLHALLDEAKAQGADRSQMAMAEDFIKGVDGTLGDNLNPTARRLFGDMIVYQNIRLLPLAIFSSVVDPVGIVVRGGTVGDAWTTFKRGIKETAKNFQKDPAADSSTQLAETMGVIDNAALVHSLGALYSQGMVGDTGRKINDKFFKYNLMEQFNTSMRVGAMEAAVKFIGKHADGTASKHSARWTEELGLSPSDVQRKTDGTVKLTEADGLSREQAAKMRSAVNQWVDGAVLRPDAADKPIWMNDPHFALVSHLKQFVYSFHETILKRVMHEAENGNYTPAMALASYVPIMIASDMIKGLIQGAGQQPDWKDNWTPEDYIWSGVQRGGLLGTGQFLADMAGDVQHGGIGVGALAGPTIEQFVDAARVLGGREQFKAFALKSMPANALYAAVAGGQATDPKFAD